MMFADLTTGLPHVRSHAVHALAVTRLKRSSIVPDLPTMDEAGVTGFELDAWCGLFGPANMPPEIVARLNAEMRKIIGSPDIKKKMDAVGFEAFSGPPDELGTFVKVQLVNWGRMIKDAGIKPD